MGTNITGIGNANAIGFKSRVTGGIYFPPELKDALVGVWSAYGKSNDSTDRNIIKNKIKDRGGDFVISNAAFKLNSGFGKYEADFTNWVAETGTKLTNDKITNSNPTKNWIAYRLSGVEFKEMHIRILGIPDNGVLYFQRPAADGGPIRMFNGDNNIPAFTSTGICGFFIYNLTGLGWSNLVIEQIPSFEGAFVTDGIDDTIISTKTLAEMGITDEVTVVSMIHQISLNPTYNNGFTNYIENLDKSTYVRNNIYKADKTGIYGYSASLTSRTYSDINNILGNKEDYGTEIVNRQNTLDRTKFSVVGRASSIREVSSIAWYWTIIANKVLTTDQINQVIAYFNLDRTLKPDILCNTIKQGITNENHAEFGDKLIDYSGNGRDIQLNNIAWDGDSGIGKYNYPNWKVNVTQGNKYTRIVYYDSINGNYSADFKGVTELYKSYGLSVEIKVNRANTIDFHSIKEDGIYTITPPDDTTSMDIRFGGENVYNASCDITITQIPSHAGALCLDGVNDFGKVTGLPIYKDYTVIADYERTDIGNIEGVGTSPVLSKSYTAGQGSFIMNFIASTGNSIRSYSFGTENTSNFNDLARQIFYQSKYKNQGFDITACTGVDGDSLWLGTARNNDSRFFNGAIYSLMSFPYSMSEFLIERQLKKHKLGTLYPDMVEFRPIIKANNNYKIFYTALLPLTGIVWEKINIGDYIPVGRRVAIQLSFDNEANELVSAISSQLGNISITKNYNNKGYTIFGDILKNKSPQKINITVDEYIRYEDIVQPYPALLRFNDENGNEVSWGGKFKVGSTITRIGSAADSNLLPNIYNIFGLLLNDNQVTSSKVIVEKTMVFKAKSAYIFDNNEPKCILSPRLLRIPNSSYKILGHIPDISGHGNHGKINNSAYASMSGANGYLLDFKTFTTGNSSLVNIKDDSRIEVININKEKSTTFVNLNKSTSISLSSWKIKVTGMKSGDTLGYYYSESTDATLRSKFDIKSDGIYSLPSSIANSNNIGGIAFDVVAGADSAYRIEQIGEYESAYCLDGVDDFVTIPTLSSGGKQVLMKVNWNTINSIIYDQRGGGGFAIYCSDYNNTSDSITVPAYKGRNAAGTTYIDGIRNEYIIASQLRNVTHNIVEILDTSHAAGKTYPIIGKSYMNANYGNLALYDFMLFDNISTDDKIKELNEYVGIEAKVELPPYYWDAYGKTNLDADKATIQQRGVAVGDYDLTNSNFAYEGMSGYNGYPVVFGENKTWVNLREYYVWTVSATKFNITQLCFTKALQFSYIKANGSIITANNKDIAPFRIKVTGIEPDKFSLRYIYLSTANATLESTITINSDGIYELPKSFASDGSLTSSDRWVGFSFIKRNTELADVIDGVNVTIEVLPEYENGLVYDGITDYSKNANIPALDDFTAIIKREWLKKQGCPLIKGSKVYEGGNGNALLLEWDKAYNFVFYKRTDIMEGELPDNISFITPTNYNGNVITRGSEQDTNGICIAGDGNAGFANMVFYKLILYPKTIPLLQINFLKNLMERDEIIDLTNPIFIQE